MSKIFRKKPIVYIPSLSENLDGVIKAVEDVEEINRIVNLYDDYINLHKERKKNS